MAEILDNVKLITNSLNRYIVKPSNAFGLGGFIFDVPAETTVTISTEITDHFTEDNSALQDHIAVKPKRLVLGQYVGEVVDRVDGTTDTGLQKAVRSLTVLTSYLPRLTAGAAQAKAIFEKSFGSQNATLKSNTFLDSLTGTLPAAVDIYGAVKNLLPPVSRQQKAYMYFKALAEQKIPVGVQTPFEFMANMGIESVVSVQGNETDGISEFTITLKELRFASTRTAKFDKTKYRSNTGTNESRVGDGKDLNTASPPKLGRAEVQAAPVVAQGNVPGRNLTILNNRVAPSATNQDILDLGKDPIFKKVYEKSAGGGDTTTALPEFKNVFTLPPA